DGKALVCRLRWDGDCPRRTGVQCGNSQLKPMVRPSSGPAGRSTGRMAMDLRQIMYFMWVYEEKSFTGASRKAGVVQPALSVQVRRLEEEFGVELFDRQSRGVV